MLFARDAEAVISASEPPRAWPLSTAGNRTAQELGGRLAGGFAEAIDVVVSSGERKAIETATALAGTSHGLARSATSGCPSAVRRER